MVFLAAFFVFLCVHVQSYSEFCGWTGMGVMGATALERS